MAEGQARNTGLSGKDVTRAGNKAYKAAMVEFQDEYWEKVSLDAGLTRTGPRRKRLSRGDWQREKASATRLARARRDAEALADRQAALEARTQVLEERESALDQQVIQMQAWTASREEALDTGCVAVKYALEALADQLPAEVADNIKRFLNQAEGIVAAAAVINAMSLRRAEATCASDNAAYSGLEMDRRSSFNSLPGQT
ncbi:hypothetical protein Y958_26030 [Nitrospirillum viridazoti CBAmc]|uniref:Uncharacterized protein n=2 Tax=Nitrospirillum TaxID=1543705 RepID=A0A248K082_9PROT|nr:hypothetical protein Y958_26030 [Nitrospirillum amazonense CBAmc]